MTITFTQLTTLQDSTDGTSYTTTSYTPPANRALLSFTNASATVAASPTGSGNGVTWTRENRTVWHGSNDIACIFSAFSGTSPSTGGFQFDCSGDAATGCTIEVLQIDGANTVDFIGQIKPSSGTLNTTPSTTFDSAIASTSGVDHVFFGICGSHPTVPPGTGYTRLLNSFHSAPQIASSSQVHASPGAITTVSWGETYTKAAWTAIAVEILAPSGGTPIVFDVSQVTETDSILGTISPHLQRDPPQVIDAQLAQKVTGFRVSDYSSAVLATIHTELFASVAQVTET